MKIVKLPRVRLLRGDCIEWMQFLIQKNIKVAAIITDPPYGTTQNKWDEIIPLVPMWDSITKVLGQGGCSSIYLRAAIYLYTGCV